MTVAQVSFVVSVAGFSIAVRTALTLSKVAAELLLCMSADGPGPRSDNS